MVLAAKGIFLDVNQKLKTDNQFKMKEKRLSLKLISRNK